MLPLLVMRNGELTEHNYNEDYNSMVYSRTAYGCSEDGKTLYMIVIDKSTDPVYGKSAGCPTSVMCEIAKHFGCWNMSNFDAGGSAEMHDPISGGHDIVKSVIFLFISSPYMLYPRITGVKVSPA